LGVSSSKLFFGVGSDEIIDLLIRIFCEPKKDSVLIPQPTYGMYQVACEINDIKVIEVPLGKGFQLDVENTLKAAQKNTKIIFLCSPNNPTGNLLTRKSILEILNKFKGIVVIDEAYIDFSEKSSSMKLLNKFENLIITRTFSKAWGLAGLRCGYSIANESITNLLFKVKAPYNMNKLTASAVLEALGNTKQKDNFVKKLNLEKDYLIKEMKLIKQIEKILPTDANFITFRISNATEIYTKLVNEGIIIRNRSSQLNLDNCLRVSVGTRKENKIFIKKLKEII
jgi:histidinol-phosphate aminotransferase